MKNEKYIHTLIILAIVGVVGAAGFVAWQQLHPGSNAPRVHTQSSGVTTFTSAKDFTAYLDSTAGLKSSFGFLADSRSTLDLENAGGPTLGLGAAEPSTAPTADRVSQTN